MDALTRTKEYLANQAADGTQRTMHAGHPDVLLAALVAEIEAAPTGIGSRDRLEENASSIIMHVAIPAAANQFQGKRVRLLALDSGGAKGGGGNLPPPLGGGDGR